MRGILGGMMQTLRTLFRPKVTYMYPFERMPTSPRFMGAPGLLWDEQADEIVCVGCNICARACPDDCIRLTMLKYTGNRTSKKTIVDEYYIDLGRCSYCGICVEVCPFDANEMTPHYEISAYDRYELVFDRDKLLAIGRGLPRRYGKEGSTSTVGGA